MRQSFMPVFQRVDVCQAHGILYLFRLTRQKIFETVLPLFGGFGRLAPKLLDCSSRTHSVHLPVPQDISVPLSRRSDPGFAQRYRWEATVRYIALATLLHQVELDSLITSLCTFARQSACLIRRRLTNQEDGLVILVAASLIHCNAVTESTGDIWIKIRLSTKILAVIHRAHARARGHPIPALEPAELSRYGEASNFRKPYHILRREVA
mmetsp:Transcript_28057/g.75827  ORF Transcript_28057/g.75827 Transcript_28057/m.75827 type:complete len:209 (-) Transcript_28057:1397-2023(-)